ncbi:helix-turn-helix domain-containing protein [Glaesserella parasuis]|nr:helix-turn-helix domain-containing protein [Glaesserella parasuis]MDE3979548.1 helix-turn-helix domain-containing protein [Glaesserella parasuis]MDE4003918.1 helix-turn-helix domain-containing protein [Glaesserella parasuis]
MAIDLNHINAAEYEFTEDELGELLLASVRQIKMGKYAERQITNEAIEARQKTGLSQSAFAKVMGISVRTLQGWEQGRRKPTGAAATLLKIAARHPETILELRS